MDDDSFDPRSWARQGAAPVPKSPETAASQPSDTTGDNPSGDSRALSEAWRDIDPAMVPGDRSTSPVTRSRQAPSGQVLSLIASSLLLAGGGLAAWLTRAPGPEAQGFPAVVASQAPQPGVIERRLTLAGLQDILGALAAAGVENADAQAAAAALATTPSRPGEVHAALQLLSRDKVLELQRLQVSFADGSGTVVTRSDSGQFSATAVAAELTRQVKVLRGELDTDSFYSSAVAAGVIDTLIPEFINAFTYDFNLASEVSPGDTFEVAYAQDVDASGKAVGQPQLLFASLTTKQKSLALYRFQAPGGEVGWFDGNGASTKRGLMRTPVDGARITSKFGMRFHPVLHYTRLHAGVDFAVPVGTPVYAAAAGTVIGATPTTCGGNMAVVQHDNGWVTRYFHLSHYAAGLHEGERVEQGFTLGQSGTTGTCTTGPHLHFELRIDGEPVDPLSVKTDDNERKRLQGDALAQFMAARNRVDIARAQQFD